MCPGAHYVYLCVLKITMCIYVSWSSLGESMSSEAHNVYLCVYPGAQYVYLCVLELVLCVSGGLDGLYEGQRSLPTQEN